jgi:hypothetical protein
MVPIIITATGLCTLKSSLARPYRLRPGPPSSTRGMSTDLEALAPIGTWELTSRRGRCAGPPPAAANMNELERRLAWGISSVDDDHLLAAVEMTTLRSPPSISLHALRRHV